MLKQTSVMINWFRKEGYSEYRQRLLNAFPSVLKSDVEAVLNILPFDVNNVELTDGQIHKVDNLIHPFSLTIWVDNELLISPCRVYFNEPDAEIENELSNIQKMILSCI
ncbi:hypothetical protein [Hymenobacter sp. UYCo722]|uniref:hypothetical protein n=1 Tax=Hymenobacter sp. UYCo722 TaxID=3156335 RepID=UPI003397357F